ncbi:sulfatase-like hydrolase/transferase [Novipirellula artificiosorum]|uniref:Arylsulfatase n=1 Tax=Novipirellula artificiosorum TaxID=2528016 RepID=A0A5C6D4V2_9BACT|nr:sulfatase-like hydrolase/transferase [Novipirellula artificiosorum]TWU30697.1 Arylsulfatase [Novipirellula artificiosorum]
MIQQLSALAIFLCLVSNSFASDRPNVLLIMADDFRDYGGAFTKAVVKTPNLDRLRSRGTTFERAYVQYPVCNPSRCSMMSGLRADPTASIKDAAFTLLTRSPKLHAQSIRTAGWRFTLWSDGQTELYNHDTDPEELKDASSHHADVVADLKARINSLPRFRAE